MDINKKKLNNWTMIKEIDGNVEQHTKSFST